MSIPAIKCSSCGACANACKSNAITMVLDDYGFYRPVIDVEKCVECKICESVCPWNKDIRNPNGSSVKPQTFAAFALDENIRKDSSSGGIFTILAEHVLKQHGIVVGVAQLSTTHFGHIVVDSKRDLEKLRGSKYVQADAGMIYKEVRSILKDGRAVLFSGTPCQIAALYSVLGGSIYENLWTVDIVCHGSPSVKVWEKYVKEIESMSNGSVKQAFFRDKRFGWKQYSLTTIIESNTKDITRKTAPMNKDPYMQAFLQNFCLNSSCSDCHYGKLPRIADISLGDYWNIGQVHPEMDDNKGTSVVLLNTEHGLNLFNAIIDKVRTCESSVEKAIDGNPCIIRSSLEHPNRQHFFHNIETLPLKKLINKYHKQPSIFKRFVGYFLHFFH